MTKRIRTEESPLSFGAVQRHAAKYQETCWGCQHPLHCGPKATPEQVDLWGAYVTNRGKMQDSELAKLLSKMHFEMSLVDEGGTPEMWPPDAVELHFTEHMKDPFSFAMNDAITAHDRIRKYRDVFKKDLTKEGVDAEKECREWMKAGREAVEKAEIARRR